MHIVCFSGGMGRKCTLPCLKRNCIPSDMSTSLSCSIILNTLRMCRYANCLCQVFRTGQRPADIWEEVFCACKHSTGIWDVDTCWVWKACDTPMQVWTPMVRMCLSVKHSTSCCLVVCSLYWFQEVLIYNEYMRKSCPQKIVVPTDDFLACVYRLWVYADKQLALDIGLKCFWDPSEFTDRRTWCPQKCFCIPIRLRRETFLRWTKAHQHRPFRIQTLWFLRFIAITRM